jgi:multiple sugar transport system permease protein/raffinose/stachyose/melibiose transport system permease protein
MSRGRTIRPALWLALPAIALVVLFFVIPNVLNFVLSFTDWSSRRPNPTFIGTPRFEELAEDEVVWNALWTTLRFAVIVMVVENVVAFLLALGLERPSRFNTVMRTVFFLPVLISPLAAGYVFLSILQTQGALNGFLGGFTALVGLPVPRIEWLADTTWTLVLVAAIHAWKYGGIHMLVYIAGLKAIPHEVVEAARMDGAGRWDLIRRVKMPLLGPAFTFNIALTLIGALSIFDIVIATTRGGPARSTEVLNMVVFSTFGSGRFSYATAVSLVLFVVILLVAFPLIWALRRREVVL